MLQPPRGRIGNMNGDVRRYTAMETEIHLSLIKMDHCGEERKGP